MRRVSFIAGTTVFIAMVVSTACTDSPAEPDTPVVTVADDAQFGVRGAKTSTGANRGCTGCAEDGTYSDALDAMNARLEAEGQEFRVAMAEILSSGQDEAAGQVVFARDVGNKQLGHDFVPNDPRRGGSSIITYVVDGVDGVTSSGPTAAQTEGAIDRAMATWDAVTCSDLNMTDLGAAPFDIGVVQWIISGGGSGNESVFADITHAGWLPAGFFDLVAPGGSTFIVGVTFTFLWIDASGATDIDNNGKADTAFREIYYNDEFPWGIDVSGTGPSDPIDVETVALHESGHGLSQGHFGKFFGTFANRKLHFAPNAVMNAVVFGQKQTLLGSDVGGHCSNWGQWPNN